MRIVAWNLQAGFNHHQERHDRAWHYLRSLGPDIAVVQESIPPEWAKNEWRIFHAPTYPTKVWGSAVVLRNEIPAWEDRLEGHRWLAELRGAVIMVTIAVDMEPLTIVSIYAPAHEVRGEAREGLDPRGLMYGGIDSIWPLYQIFFDLIDVLPDRKFIAGGDFNAARLMDDVPSMIGGSRDFFDTIERGGFFNCLAKFHEGEVQTFFQAGKRPYQLDHLYCSGDLGSRLEKCQVLRHAVTKLGLSDHAPIVADFAF